MSLVFKRLGFLIFMPNCGGCQFLPAWIRICGLITKWIASHARHWTFLAFSILPVSGLAFPQAPKPSPVLDFLGLPS